jgi:PQQ enzyme repeat/PQQ-like domain
MLGFMSFVRTTSRLLATIWFFSLFSAPPSNAAAGPYDWLQFMGNARHDGNNTLEGQISAATVSQLTFAFQITLPSIADGAPAYLGNVSTPSGVHDVLFLTTKAGHILALDAHTGATVWSHQYGPGTCKINNGSSACYTTSSPAIDPDRSYVYSYGLDGYVHKYQVGDGAEILTGGWPELATTKGFDEKESPALAIATSGGVSYLYVANGGYPGDNGDYQGHITAINLSDGTQNVFNSLCSDQAVHFVHSPNSPDCSSVQSAIWARPGVIYDAGTDRIFMATGNGNYDGTSGGHDWGDSVFALNPNGTGSLGKPLDSYTPTNYSSLDSADLDLGSTAPAILPAPPACNVQHLAVQGGKDAKLRLLNLENLSGQSGPGHMGGEVGSIINVPQGGPVLTQPAVWINPADNSTWAFVANNNGISGLRLSIDLSGNPSLVSQWQKSFAGTSPLVANGVLFLASSNIARALDPTTGNVLWSDNTKIGGIHWESPVVANGWLYATDESSHLTAYKIPFPTITSFTGTPTPPQPVNTKITWTATASGGVAPLQYEFWVYNGNTSSWSVGQAYGTSNTFAWTPTQAGAYMVNVWVRNAGSSNAYDAWKTSGSFNITGTGGAPTISSLTPSPAPPQPVNTKITWTATASGGVAPLQYEFWVYNGNTSSWSVGQAYGTSNTFAWTPTQAGAYMVNVWVRNAGSSNAYDAWKTSGSFNITGP